MEKIELLLIMVTNTKHLKLHRGNHDLSSIYHILSKFQAYQGLLIWQASKFIKNIFLIFLLVTMGSIISVNLIHSIARR